MDLLSEAVRVAVAPRVPPDAVQRILAKTGASIDELMLALIPAAQKYARPLISGYNVGAVALGATGTLYFGANLELKDSALHCTVHAEQAAVVHAAVCSEPAIVKLAVSAPPCGYCRQFLYELVGAEDLQILLSGQQPTLLTDYLPHPFGPRHLGVEGGLLSPQVRQLEWLNAPGDRLADCEFALNAARRSYAPYTRAIGAVGLILQDGETLAGPYLENAAFNPSISPIQAAAVSLALANRTWAAVTTAICVQTEDSKVDHAPATRYVLGRMAPHVRVEEFLVREVPLPEESSMAKRSAAQKDLSFYFFDFDDNIMFLQTPILLQHRKTKRIERVSTEVFASIRALLGQPGRWSDFQISAETYSHFRDVPELKEGQRQHFVEDIEKAIEESDESWKGPSWPLFVHACEKQRPTAIITARGHSRATLEAGFELLVDRGLIPRVPNLFAVYPVANPETAKMLEATETDPERLSQLKKASDATSLLKRLAIHDAVETGLEAYGHKPEHRFGMSDDDPQNVDLIIKAMAECKVKHPDKRFFVINTHHGEWVKLEVFPVDFPVTGRVSESEIVG